MKMKKILSLILVAMLALSALTGCGKKETVAEDKSGETTTVSETKGEEPAEAPYTVKLMMFGDATTEASEEVAAAINKISLPAINVNVEILRVGFGSYNDQLGLALSSNEKLDVFVTLGPHINEYGGAGQIVPFNPYLDVEGIDIKNGVSAEDFKSLSIGDDIYAFPSAKETATSYGFIMLQSIVDELGITVDPNHTYTLDEIQVICEQAKALHPDMYPIGPDFTNMYFPNAMDNLDGAIAVLEDVYSGSTTVVNWHETETYKNFVTKMYEWENSGLILPDAVNNSEGRTSLILAGKVMGGFNGFNPGNVTGLENGINGQQMAEFKMMEKPFSVTGHVTGIAWCIAQNSENPAKAMAFLNLAYSNAEVSNLLTNGIEGKDYVVTDAATNYIDYPEGVDAATANARWMRLAWATPNAAITYNFKGEAPDQWEFLTNYNKSAYQSPAKGFRFDPTAVLNEITACNNITAKYDVALLTGSLDPAETLPKFNAELKDAGVEKIIAEKQKQLDAFLAK